MRNLRPSYAGPLDLVLGVLTAAGLVIDAVVHLHLASLYDHNGSTITQGDIFRVEASVALLVAVLVLVAPWRRLVYLAAVAIAASAFGAVMLYRYVNVGSIGPLPNMYEPIWFGQKTLSAYAEAGAALAAAGGLVQAMRYRRRTSAA
jgi:hypothetical protein